MHPGTNLLGIFCSKNNHYWIVKFTVYSWNVSFYQHKKIFVYKEGNPSTHPTGSSALSSLWIRSFTTTFAHNFCCQAQLSTTQTSTSTRVEYSINCHTRAPSWILSYAENLASFSLQDGATKWYHFLCVSVHNTNLFICN